MAQFNVTELDFDKIKENLIEYYKKFPDEKYKDYDFDGSGLNILMDILAYNTHHNAILAHTSINEAFIDSAQLRSNVVSRAKSLGYTPNSIRGAYCSLRLEFDGEVNNNEELFTLEAGKTIKSSIDGSTYVFITLNDYIAELNEEGKYVFEGNNGEGVLFYQGALNVKSFVVRDTAVQNQKYFIDDQSADLSTLKVKVKNNIAATGFDIYKRFTTFSNLDNDDRVYFLSENYDGSYLIEFGNDTLGRKPTGQNVIELEYLSTDGSIVNGASQFSWADDNPLPTKIEVISKAAGGSEKENIESIRFNAPLTYAAQERAVTADDYLALIKRDFPAAHIISVWGGQDNNPPRYGTVFISIKPHGDAANLTYAEKKELEKTLSPKNVASTDVSIVDPDYTYLYFDLSFKYNSNQTDLPESTLETKVRQGVETFNDEFLSSFNTAFRFSNFLNKIDESDQAIISSNARLYVYKQLELKSYDSEPKTLFFDFELFGDVKDANSMITTDSFNYLGQIANLGDEPLDDTTRRVYAYTTTSNGQKTKIVKDVGRLTPSTGLLQLNPISLDILGIDEEGEAIEASQVVNFYTIPASNNVVAKRNTLIQIDSSKTRVFGNVDTIEVGGASGAIKYSTFNRHS